MRYLILCVLSLVAADESMRFEKIGSLLHVLVADDLRRGDALFIDPDHAIYNYGSALYEPSERVAAIFSILAQRGVHVIAQRKVMGDPAVRGFITFRALKGDGLPFCCKPSCMVEPSEPHQDIVPLGNNYLYYPGNVLLLSSEGPGSADGLADYLTFLGGRRESHPFNRIVAVDDQKRLQHMAGTCKEWEIPFKGYQFEDGAHLTTEEAEAQKQKIAQLLAHAPAEFVSEQMAHCTTVEHRPTASLLELVGREEIGREHICLLDLDDTLFTVFGGSIEPNHAAALVIHLLRKRGAIVFILTARPLNTPGGRYASNAHSTHKRLLENAMIVSQLPFENEEPVRVGPHTIFYRGIIMNNPDKGEAWRDFMVFAERYPQLLRLLQGRQLVAVDDRRQCLDHLEQRCRMSGVPFHGKLFINERRHCKTMHAAHLARVQGLVTLSKDTAEELRNALLLAQLDEAQPPSNMAMNLFE